MDQGQPVGVTGPTFHFGVRAADGTYLDPEALFAGVTSGPIWCPVPTTGQRIGPPRARARIRCGPRHACADRARAGTSASPRGADRGDL